MSEPAKSFYQFFCANCKKPIEWNSNPFRPFCSDRCKKLDLGKWATEAYRVPGPPVDEAEENVTILDEGEDD